MTKKKLVKLITIAVTANITGRIISELYSENTDDHYNSSNSHRTER